MIKFDGELHKLQLQTISFMCFAQKRLRYYHWNIQLYKNESYFFFIQIWNGRMNDTGDLTPFGKIGKYAQLFEWDITNECFSVHPNKGCFSIYISHTHVMLGSPFYRYSNENAIIKITICSWHNSCYLLQLIVISISEIRLQWLNIFMRPWTQTFSVLYTTIGSIVYPVIGCF